MCKYPQEGKNIEQEEKREAGLSVCEKKMADETRKAR
jgi:hypothetical protein